MKPQKLILKLNEVGLKDIDTVGDKNAALGDMIKNLSHLGVKVPSGFLLTINAYQDFIAYNKLDSFINDKIVNANINQPEELEKCGAAIRQKIAEGHFPDNLVEQIKESYEVLSLLYRKPNIAVAISTSVIGNSLPNTSFNKLGDSLNVIGIDQILNAVKECFAAFFTDEAILYRENKTEQEEGIGLSVCIHKMINSDSGSSGIAYSIDKESGFEEVIVINGSYGLGGIFTPEIISSDEFITYKPLLKNGYPAIIEKKIGDKHQKHVCAIKSNGGIDVIPTTDAEQQSFCLNKEKVLGLSKKVVEIENHFSKLKEDYCPVSVQWALDGETKELLILGAEPIINKAKEDRNIIVNYKIAELEERKVLLNGIAIGERIGAGEVKIVSSIHTDLSKIDFKKGDVLVTEMTDPNWEPIMEIASAIIIEKGGRSCHAAIVARELGIPTIVNCVNATSLLKNGDLVTVSCAEGEKGVIYKELLIIQKNEVALNSLPQTITPVLLNVGSPDKAFEFANYPHAGIGLARMEFIINNYIKIHPLALLNKLEDEDLNGKIEKAIAGYENGEEYFIEKLSNGLAKIAASCYPRQVIVRFSDFKSNEYANLLGGKYFEPDEKNPMIGWRGASRYYSDIYKNAFGLECKAIKNVREKLGLDNITAMIPFCRTIDELKKVYAVMEENGLKRKEKGLQVYLMAELPSNFILAEDFAEHVDGFSIGSNDLTQLVLGLDRDSAQVAHLYDERNAAVKKMISMLVDAVEGKKVKVGICGQGPSDFPDFAQFLAEAGIDTISVTPDSFAKTVNAVADVESKQKKRVFRMSHYHSFI